MNPFRTFSRLAWAVALCAALVVILLVVSWCSERQRGKDAEAVRDLAQGRTASAVEAITEIGELGQRADATDAQVKEAQDAVRNAPEDQRDAVARYHLCVMHNRTDCQRVQ